MYNCLLKEAVRSSCLVQWVKNPTAAAWVAAEVWIRFLAQRIPGSVPGGKLPGTAGAAIKRKKRKKKKKKEAAS